ncbi:MAG: DNA cytosine methyltransferase [Planctomycetia bacterium]|nr:DNA cytosine methyltransferase [Planctomycetia bacterium]
MTRRARPAKKPRPTAIDLFAGCGGLTLGLKQAGFSVLGAIELCKLASHTYASNHKEPYLWQGDIRNISVESVKRRLRLRKHELDLLAGCPPCQGFSSMRTRNGRRRPRDSRNDLLFEFLRFVEELMPKTVMLENVPGLGRTVRMRQFVRQLRLLGYHVNWDILNAAHYAVPQRRRRLILLASRIGNIEFAKPARITRTVRDAIASIKPAGSSGDDIHDVPESRSPEIAELIRRIPKNGGSRAALGDNEQLPCHRDCDGFKDVYGRMAWNDVAPTITGGCVNPSKGRFLHPSANRCITLREAACLQGFPRRYRFSLDRGKFPVAEMIGNALPPEFVRRHAAAVRRHLAREYS